MATIGIDIGGRSHALARCRDGETRADREILRVSQSRAGFAALDAWLERQTEPVTLVTMESSGHYPMPLASHLRRHDVQVAVVDPLAAKYFAKSRLARTKSDPADARSLAEMAMRDMPEARDPLLGAELRQAARFAMTLVTEQAKVCQRLVRRPARSVARAVAGDLLKRRDPVLAASRARSSLDARSGRVDRDPFNAFDFLMDASERHGLRSVFYFMAGNNPTDCDFRYRLSDPVFGPLLRRIHERGHEVGLHASYVSHGSAERIRMEFDALRAACRAAGFDQPTWGVRQHYLRLENPQTWRNQESAGLEHDSTLGFADRIGFRAGTCREYPLFDLRGHRRLDLRERPLVLMDTTLFEYMALGADEAAARARAIVDECRRHRGDAVLLFHNSSLPGTRQRAYYRNLVEMLSHPS